MVTDLLFEGRPSVPPRTAGQFQVCSLEQPSPNSSQNAEGLLQTFLAARERNAASILFATFAPFCGKNPASPRACNLVGVGA